MQSYCRRTPSPVEQLANAAQGDDGTHVVAGHRVRNQSPAHRAAVYLLEKMDYVRQAERFEDDARQLRIQAQRAVVLARGELEKTEGYVRYVGRRSADT